MKYDEDGERRMCQCEDCGKRFRHGDEGDNERFCLRCEHRSRIDRMSQEDREYYEVYGDEDVE
jgi:hypothetical protein